MDIGLRGKVTLVSGGVAGNRALQRVAELAAEGARVAIGFSRAKERMETVAGEHGGAAMHMMSWRMCNVAAGLVYSVEDDLGPIDIRRERTRAGRPAASRSASRASSGSSPTASSCWLRRADRAGLSGAARARLRAGTERGLRGEPLLRAKTGTDALELAPPVAAFKTLASAHARAGITFDTLLPGRIATQRLAHIYGSLEAAHEAAPDEIPAGRSALPRTWRRPPPSCVRSVPATSRASPCWSTAA